MTATISQLAQASAITNAVAENSYKSTDNDLSAREVGLIFVHEYYTHLSNNPNKIHAFYSHDSIMVRGNEAEDPVTAQGEEAIRRCLEETPLESTKVRLDSVDSVGSAHSGILVQVLGDMVSLSIGVRRFSQTFFLATQPNGFYILTDILRFLKEDPVVEETTKQGNRQNVQAKEAPLPDTTMLTISAETPIKPSSLDNIGLPSIAVTTVSTPVIASATVVEEEVEQEDTSEDKANEEQKEQEEVVVTAETQQEDENKPKTPKTWSIVAAGLDAKRDSSVTASSPVPESPAAGSKLDSQGASSKHAQNKEQQSTGNRVPVPKEEQVDVFLKNVKNLTNEQIMEACTAAIGEVKSVTIHNNKTTAFLTFTTPEACQKALEQRRVEVGDVTVLIEERRPSTSRFPRHHHSGGGRGESFGERRFGQNRRGGGLSRGGKMHGTGSAQK